MTKEKPEIVGTDKYGNPVAECPRCGDKIVKGICITKGCGYRV